MSAPITGHQNGGGGKVHPQASCQDGGQGDFAGAAADGLKSTRPPKSARVEPGRARTKSLGPSLGMEPRTQGLGPSVGMEPSLHRELEPCRFDMEEALQKLATAEEEASEQVAELFRQSAELFRQTEALRDFIVEQEQSTRELHQTEAARTDGEKIDAYLAALVDNGKVVGIALKTREGTEAIGEIVPTPLIEHFLTLLEGSFALEDQSERLLESHEACFDAFAEALKNSRELHFGEELSEDLSEKLRLRLVTYQEHAEERAQALTETAWCKNLGGSLIHQDKERGPPLPASFRHELAEASRHAVRVHTLITTCIQILEGSYRSEHTRLNEKTSLSGGFHSASPLSTPKPADQLAPSTFRASPHGEYSKKLLE